MNLKTLSVDKGFILCMGILILFMVCTTYVIMHDGEILKNASNDATKQYFMQYNTTMSGQERLELSHSICNETFTNKTLHDELIFSSAIDWDMCIERCTYQAIGVKIE